MQDEEGKTMTVTEYYKNNYNKIAVDHDNPVLIVHELPPRAKDKGKSNILYLCPELVFVTGYPPELRKNHSLMKKISRTNKLPSDDRAKKTLGCSGRLSKKAKQIGSPLIIEPTFAQIQAKLYSPSDIYLLNTKKGKPETIQIDDLQMKWKRFGMFDQKMLG
eukprot:UN28495